MKSWLMVLLGGALFGAGLALSGMTDPSRVLAFLDISGSWDPTLAFVMGGALGTFALGYAVLKRRCNLPGGESEPVSRRLLIGSALFGIGWGLGGFCPGPALVNLARLSTEAMCFIPAMAVGMIIAQRGFGADSP